MVVYTFANANRRRRAHVLPPAPRPTGAMSRSPGRAASVPARPEPVTSHPPIRVESSWSIEASRRLLLTGALRTLAATGALRYPTKVACATTCMRVPAPRPVAKRPAAFADLRMFRVFQHFDDETLAAFAAFAHEQNVPAGQVIYTEGDTSEDFWVLVAGGVVGDRATPVGRQAVLRGRVGQLFGEISILDRKPRSATVVANQTSALLQFDGAALRSVLDGSTVLAVELLRAFWHSLAAKVRQANHFMIDIVTPGGLIAPNGHRSTSKKIDVNPGTKLDLFRERGLSAAELRLFATTLGAQRFGAEDIIFLEGDKGECLYIVVDGQVRISRQLPGMGEEALAILGRGEVFGEMALVDDQPRSADARAHIGGCTLLTVTQADLDELLHLTAAAAAQFLRLLCCILCRRLRQMTDLLVSYRIMAGPTGDDQPPLR